MNKAFLEAIEQLKTSPERTAMVESVKELYSVCERKAQLEGKFGKTLASMTLAGLGLLGLNHVTGNPFDKAVDSAANGVKQTVHEWNEEGKKFNKDELTVAKAQNYSYYGDELLNLGWKFVSAKEHPGLYSDSYRDMPLDSIEARPETSIGWIVSPDKKVYYSTVTGKVFQMPEGQTFDDATASNPGKFLGTGTPATKKVDYDPNHCDLKSQGMTGCKDPKYLSAKTIAWRRGHNTLGL